MGTHNGGAEVTDHASPSVAPSWRARPEARPHAGGERPDDPKDPTTSPREGDDVELEDKPISATPRRYKVIFHNDDYTTMEFVVDVLKRFFHKTETEAAHIMLTVHKSGAASPASTRATSPRRSRPR